MGRTKMLAGTKSRATAQYKVKKLTPRRITMIKDFLTRTVDSPENVGNYFGSVAWMDKLIEFLREPIRCRSTRMDIVTWLKDSCFVELIDQVTRSAAKRINPSLGTVEKKSLSQVNMEPMSSPEDLEMETGLPLAAIKQEILAEDNQGFENDGHLATGNQEDEQIFWGLSTIKEEAELVTINEELMLDDDKNCVQEDASSEERPKLSRYTDSNAPPEQSSSQPQHSDEQKTAELPRSFDSRKDFTDLLKKRNDTMLKIVQNEQKKRGNARSPYWDWDTVYQALCITQKVLKDFD